MRKSAAGVYSYLPLGVRVLHKIMAIIREELDRAGGQEILLPIVQPAERWHESGRWNDYGPEMFRLVDRHQRQFCLGPTHEEIITALVRDEVRSYSCRLDCTRFRTNTETRSGLALAICSREFIMKDLTFDRDEAGHRRVTGRCTMPTHASSPAAA